MTPLDPRIQSAVLSAVQRIRGAAVAAASRTADGLGASAMSANGARQRDALLSGQYELGRRLGAFNQRFAEVLNERALREVHSILGHPGTGRRLQDTDWHTLALVQDDEVEELVSADRLGQAIAMECEWELRELSTYIGALLGTGQAEQDRNPLRPEVIGKALFRAVEAVSTERGTQALLVRELGRALASTMRACYSEIIADLQARGIQPVGLTVRGVDGPGNDILSASRQEGPPSRFDSRYDTGPGHEVLGLPSTGKPTDIGSSHFPSDSGYDSGDTVPGGFGPSSGGLGSGRHGAGPTRYPASNWRGESPAQRFGSRLSREGQTRRHGPVGPALVSDVEPQLIALIRRLALFGDRDDRPGPRAPGKGAAPASGGPSPAELRAAMRTAPEAQHSGSGVVPSNLIRTHRETLRQMSTGAIDHMLIDVVGALFEEILSDPKVSPQMARQIARLQLPVLRVALSDATFFSSRRHPVRRFVDRIASLSCAFDDFENGPGLELIRRVRAFVQEIVESDFDQMGLYEAKLAALEGFVAKANEEDVERDHATASLLHGKESELRQQQRYTQALQAALASLQMPVFMREFVTQVWSQTILRVARRDGVQSESAKRMRIIGRELVMSLQPKGSPAHRKQFLLKLPQLMKDLNEGLGHIGWPEAGRKAFFGHLMPAHAESLKGTPITELDYNLMARDLDGILLRTLPLREDASPVPSDATEIPELTDVLLDNQFTPEEAQKIGLVTEAAVDWSGRIEIDIGPEGLAPGAHRSSLEQPEFEDTTPETNPRDVDLEGLVPTDPPEPHRGPDLMAHLHIGMAYQMYLKDVWQKVRLSFISPGRAFFVFTHGPTHQETISMTARMVARMCESDRLRAHEHAQLLERATHRAREQLAELSASLRAPPPAAAIVPSGSGPTAPTVA